MYLKYEDIAISLGSIRINSFQTGAPQFVLDTEGISGLDDGPGTKRNNTPRPISWGDFSEPGYKSARLITITGTAVAPSPLALQSMRDDFMGELQHGKYEEMKIQTGDLQGERFPVGNSINVISRYVNVGIEGTPRWTRQSDTIATFKLELYAPDPRIYGDKQIVMLTDSTVSGGLALPAAFPLDFDNPRSAQITAIYNRGNTDSWPTFVVTGDYYLGFEISNSRNSIVRFDGIVTGSSPVTIDMLAGTAIQDGVDKSNLLSRRDWFSIPSLASIQPTFTPVQDAWGKCDIIFRDTWI